MVSPAAITEAGLANFRWERVHVASKVDIIINTIIVTIIIIIIIVTIITLDKIIISSGTIVIIN